MVEKRGNVSISLIASMRSGRDFILIKETCDYIFQLSNISVWYYIASIVIGMLIGFISKKWKIGALIGYCLIVFSIAVLNRKSGSYIKNYILFYKYKQGFNAQIFANIFLFVPIGILLASICWKVIPVGILFSIVIECSQLWLKRGMFDVDDIVSNTIGITIGVTITFILRIICLWLNRWRTKYNEQ